MRLLGRWFARLRELWACLARPRVLPGPVLLLDVDADKPAPTDMPPGLPPLDRLARQSRGDAEATLSRLARRLPPEIGIMGELRGDSLPVQSVLSQWRGWPSPVNAVTRHLWLRPDRHPGEASWTGTPGDSELPKDSHPA